MANFYDDRAIDKLAGAYAEMRGSSTHLQERCLGHPFRSERARKFARYGLARRSSSLVKCIANTFELIPPNLSGLPAAEALRDAEIQVQAFVVNVFGCLDNLAWIWVEERSIKNPKNGEELRPEWVGLRPKNEVVMGSLDDNLREYLGTFEKWFEYIEPFRHALAHQIPLYIPPFGFRPGCEARYHELETAISEHILRGDLAELDTLKKARDEQVVFRPYILGTQIDETTLVPFHWQMLCDFKTIVSISTKILDALAVGP